jgi:hypothetical protein
MNAVDRPARLPLSPQEGWISDGRQVLHFKPKRYDRAGASRLTHPGAADPGAPPAAA